MAYCHIGILTKPDLAKPIVDPERSFGNAANDPGPTVFAETVLWREV